MCRGFEPRRPHAFRDRNCSHNGAWITATVVITTSAYVVEAVSPDHWQKSANSGGIVRQGVIVQRWKSDWQHFEAVPEEF